MDIQLPLHHFAQVAVAKREGMTVPDIVDVLMKTYAFGNPDVDAILRARLTQCVEDVPAAEEST